MKSSALSLFIILFFGLVLSENEICPKVYDGITDGRFDLSTQFSLTSVSANWEGLTSDDIIGYEWAIISQNKASKLNSECRLNPGFFGIPDVQDWADVKKQNFALNSQVKLVPETTYYVVLRTTLKNGVQVFSNSNGVIVLPQEVEERINGKEVEQKSVLKGKQNSEKIALQSSHTFVTESCSIDNENRCRQSKQTVHDYLNTIYGKPQFITAFPVAAVPIVVIDDDGADDDEGDDEGTNNNAIVIATVVGGTLILLCLLCLLCLLFVVTGKKGDDEKFTERITEKNVEHVDAEGGSFKEHSIGNENKIEFPDIDPHSRLSVA